MTGGPRTHHYFYAHKMLPNYFFDNPALFIATLLEHRDEFLKKVWNDLGQRVEANDGPQARLDDQGLRVYFERFPKEVLVAVVEMPEAKFMPEAHFVAFIFQLPESDVGRPLGARRGIARVLTLEFGLNITVDQPRTVLCEWNAEGAHLNMGDGPAATLEDFIQRIASLI